MKRARETTHEEDSLVPFGVLGDAFADAFLAYILSFAWKSFYSLALVCKNFYRLTSKSRTFWREVALRVYHEKIPKDVLEHVDFFHGLKEEDPPWSYFCDLFANSTDQDFKWGHVKGEKDGNLYLRYYKEQDRGWYCVMRLHFVCQNNQWWYSQSLSIRNNSALHKTGDLTHTIYIGHDSIRKRSHVNAYPQVVNTYVEIWDPVRQKTWYGEPGQKIGVIKSNHFKDLYPNKESFGVWI